MKPNPAAAYLMHSLATYICLFHTMIAALLHIHSQGIPGLGMTFPSQTESAIIAYLFNEHWKQKLI